MASSRLWPALTIEAPRVGFEDLVAAVLDDYSPAAIEDLRLQPIPPGGLWDPTFTPIPEPPPAPIHWRAFFNDVAARDAAAADLRARIPELALELTDVADDNWAAKSQASLTAIRAGSFIVAPPWDKPAEVAAGETLIVIEPSRGFGTGHHASTRLCLRLVADVDVRGTRVLDLGTGSGVLAMAAALRGAREVLALDVDADAIDAARESAAMNPLPRAIDFRVADFRTDAPDLTARSYDVVLANLTGGMLTQSADRIASFLAAGGSLIVSGFDDNERAGVQAAFIGLREIQAYGDENWVGLRLSQ